MVVVLFSFSFLALYFCCLVFFFFFLGFYTVEGLNPHSLSSQSFSNKKESKEELSFRNAFLKEGCILFLVTSSSESDVRARRDFPF